MSILKAKIEIKSSHSSSMSILKANFVDNKMAVIHFVRGELLRTYSRCIPEESKQVQILKFSIVYKSSESMTVLRRSTMAISSYTNSGMHCLASRRL